MIKKTVCDIADWFLGKDSMSPKKLQKLVCGIYTGNQLESIAHKESPWIEARGNCHPAEACTNEITDKSIYRCYIERVV